MIENDENPLNADALPPISSGDPAIDPADPATIQIPTSHAVATITPTTHPYVSVEDLLSLQLVSDPQISPDGTHIAFSVQQSDGQHNKTSSAIWLVRSKGGKGETAWQVTSGDHQDFAPRWSPDGNTLAFLSDRSDTVQLYLLSMRGGEARQVSRLQQGITEYSWRPGGQAILAHSLWKPDDERNKPDNSTTACMYTRLDEHWDGIGHKQGRHQQLWLVPLEGAPTRLTFEPVDLVQASWSPDGSEIAFCANRRSDPDLSVSMALWVLTVATGQMRRLTPEEGLAQMPAWSPDGQSIAYYYSPDQTEASNVSPWVVNAHDNSSPRPIAAGEDMTCQEFIIDELHMNSLSRPQWYADGNALLIAIQKRGQVHLYRIDITNNQLTQLTSGNGCYVSPQLSNDGQTIAMLRIDWFTPGDIWCMDSNGENRRKLTGVNDAFLRSHQLIRPKRITWESADGLEIEGWLYLPPVVEDAKAPLILEIHGGPTLAWGDSYVHEFQVLAGRGYAVLAINPRGSSGYGEAFCQKILNDWGGDDFHDLMAGIDHVIATEPVEGSRLGLGGLSYGGYMTDWAITQTNRFKAAVSRNGISDLNTASTLSDQTLWFDLALDGGEHDRETFRKSRSALPFVERITTPLLLLHAKDDLRCPASESMQLFVALRKRKRTVELVFYPNVSHLIDWPGVGTPEQRVDRLQRTIDWFAKFV